MYFRHHDAFKCNLKELTTKSTLSAWGQRSSMACTCPVAGYIDHVIFWRVQFSFMLGSVSHFLPLTPPPRLCWFFSTDVFSVTEACSFPVGAQGWVALLCQSWGAWFQSRGWKPWLGFKRRATAVPNPIHKL